MRWLVLGCAGQLGTHLSRQLETAGQDVIGRTRHDLDITSAAAVDDALTATRPDVVVNAAAYTAVDAAESDEATATLVNGTAVGFIARSSSAVGARLLHVSTDYVFAGDASHPYEPDDPTGPRTAYGRSKLAGEVAALTNGATVVRTAWVYGGPGPNFVDTMLALERTRDTVDVVDDQIGSPTWVADLATALVELGRSALSSEVLHYAGAGSASWFELARHVFACTGHDPERVRPVPSTRFVRPAPRPAWSVLSTQEWVARGLTAPRPWQDAVTEHVASLSGR